MSNACKPLQGSSGELSKDFYKIPICKMGMYLNHTLSSGLAASHGFSILTSPVFVVVMLGCLSFLLLVSYVFVSSCGFHCAAIACCLITSNTTIDHFEHFVAKFSSLSHFSNCPYPISRFLRSSIHNPLPFCSLVSISISIALLSVTATLHT